MRVETSARGLFGPFAGRVWLNAAHQGPLPAVAVAAAIEMLAQKVRPTTLPDESFFELPHRLRASLARLIGASPSDVILAKSTSYGLDLLAHGLGLAAGDEVLIVEGDFPATVTPWLILEKSGVRIRRLVPRERPLSAGQLEQEINSKTRVFCSSWVFSFSGEAIDVAKIGDVCRKRGVTFVLNGSQAIGARPIDVASSPVDALVSAGYKWLCGPYATRFCWMTPGLRDRLDYHRAYWLTQMSGTDLSTEGPASIRKGQHAEQYDVFAPANFLNFAPLLASIDLLLEIGIEAIATHDQALVQRLVDGLAGSTWRVVSPPKQPQRSTLVVIEHDDAHTMERAASRLAQAGFDIAACRAATLLATPVQHLGGHSCRSIANPRKLVPRLVLMLAAFTPSQLAEDAGVGQATISRALAGRPLTPVSWLGIATTLAGYPKNPAVEALLSKLDEAA